MAANSFTKAQLARRKVERVRFERRKGQSDAKIRRAREEKEPPKLNGRVVDHIFFDELLE